jgi:hypothetical protein
LPSPISCSAILACSSASSGVVVTNAVSTDSTSARRASDDRVTSTGETSLVRIFSATSSKESS